MQKVMADNALLPRHEIQRRVGGSESSGAFWIANSILPLDTVGAVFDWRW